MILGDRLPYKTRATSILLDVHWTANAESIGLAPRRHRISMLLRYVDTSSASAATILDGSPKRPISRDHESPSTLVSSLRRLSSTTNSPFPSTSSHSGSSSTVSTPFR